MLASENQLNLHKTGFKWRQSELTRPLSHKTVLQIWQLEIACSANPLCLQSDLELVPEILLGIPEARLQAMQAALGRVWHRFLWSDNPMHQTVFQPVIQQNLAMPPRSKRAYEKLGHESPLSLPEPQHSNLIQDDAFATLMQALYGRL